MIHLQYQTVAKRRVHSVCTKGLRLFSLAYAALRSCLARWLKQERRATSGVFSAYHAPTCAAKAASTRLRFSFIDGVRQRFSIDPGSRATTSMCSRSKGDLTDLPPGLLHVGADEILLDDARRYAHLLANSGPAADLHVWEGMVHVFPANLVLLQAAREALDLAGEFLWRRRSLSDMLRLSVHHHSHGETT